MKKNNLSLEVKDQDFYVQIRHKVVDEIIEHGLTQSESKLFFYLIKLNPSSDTSVEVKVGEVLLATGISKAAYYRAIAKFETMGWFSFKQSGFQITKALLNQGMRREKMRDWSRK